MSRYDGLKTAIADEIQRYESQYFTYDEPIPFCGLKIYPITMREYNDFFITNACFLLNKNEDPQGIRKTHLDYLIGKINDPEEGPLWSYRFSRLLELIFHIQNGLRCVKCGNVITYAEYLTKGKELIDSGHEDLQVACPNCESTQFEQMIRYALDENTKKYILYIDGKPIDSSAFERLRQIVLYQNLPDYYDDSKIDPALKKDQAERVRIKGQNAAKASLEKKFVCVAAKTSYKIEELYNLSIRKFLMLLYTVDDVLEYEATRIGMMTGMVSLKNPPDHWIYKKEKDVLGDTYKSLDSFKDELSQV